jgi:hypothetical protein
MKRVTTMLWGAGLLSLSLALTGAEAQRVRDYALSGAALVRQSTGLNNPYTLLRRPEARMIASAALEGPLSEERVAALLRGSEVQIDNLLETSVLRRNPDGTYGLAMTVLTVEDRELIDRVSDPMGRSLAEAFLGERAAFDRILSRYDLDGVDPAMVRMALIGCVVLDWDGLRVTAEQNYRSRPVPRANGDRYQMVLRERAPHISERALYWGSHNNSTAGDTIWMTTFGDQMRGTKRVAFPDLTGIIEGPDLQAHAPPPVAAFMAETLSAGLEASQQTAGRIMIALRAGPANAAALAAAAQQPLERVQRVLDLLAALLYVELRDGRYRAAVPVFTFDRDGAMIAEYRALGQRVIRDWLAANYGRIQQQLSSLAALRAGVPYRTMFTELWHPIFGWANYHLVREGYLHDPNGPNPRFVGFVPFVWDAQLRLQSFYD